MLTVTIGFVKLQGDEALQLRWSNTDQKSVRRLKGFVSSDAPDSLFSANHINDLLMPLEKWLDQEIAFQHGRALSVREVIQSVADKQHAHTIKRNRKNDTFGNGSIALVSPEAPSSEIDTVDFEVPWQHAIVAPAVKLLHSVKSPDKTPLIRNCGVIVPDSKIGAPCTLRRRRSSLRPARRG